MLWGVVSCFSACTVCVCTRIWECWGEDLQPGTRHARLAVRVAMPCSNNRKWHRFFILPPCCP